jgi:hypothetical protein
MYFLYCSFFAAGHHLYPLVNHSLSNFPRHIPRTTVAKFHFPFLDWAIAFCLSRLSYSIWQIAMHLRTFRSVWMQNKIEVSEILLPRVTLGVVLWEIDSAGSLCWVCLPILSRGEEDGRLRLNLLFVGYTKDRLYWATLT